MKKTVKSVKNDSVPDVSMTEQAYRDIRRDILTCVLHPGEAISEATLTDRYGFGKAPIRAALSRLRQDGLVSASPRRSYIVSPITLRDVEELYALRLVLEPAAARLAAGRVDAERLERLDSVCSKGYRLGDAASILSFLEANHDFHLQIAEASGNLRFVKLLGQVLDETTRLMVIGLGLRNRNDEMSHEHDALVHALRDGDGELAAHLLIEQINASRDMVQKAILGSPSWRERTIGG